MCFKKLIEIIKITDLHIERHTKNAQKRALTFLENRDRLQKGLAAIPYDEYTQLDECGAIAIINNILDLYNQLNDTLND